MSLESATYVGQLVPTNPTPTDPKSQGDDHLRLLKQVLQNTFPNSNGVYQGGQMLGSVSNKAVFYNNQTIAENLTLPSGSNGLSAGPITINNGYTVTVESGSVWSTV